MKIRECDFSAGWLGKTKYKVYCRTHRCDVAMAADHDDAIALADQMNNDKENCDAEQERTDR